MIANILNQILNYYLEDTKIVGSEKYNSFTGVTSHVVDSNVAKTNHRKRLLVGVLAGLSYYKVINLEKVSTFDDITIELALSANEKAHNLLSIWNSLCSDISEHIDDPSDYIQFVCQMQLDKLRSLENDSEMEEWYVEKLLVYSMDKIRFLDSEDGEIMSYFYDLCEEVRQKIDFELYGKKILLVTNNLWLIKNYIIRKNEKVVICSNGGYIEEMKLIKSLFNTNVEILERGNEEKALFCFEESIGTFDTVICSLKNIDDVFGEAIDYLKFGGTALLHYGKEKKKLTKAFYDNTIPLYAHVQNSGDIVVMKKRVDTYNTVYNINIQYDYDFAKFGYSAKSLASYIINHNIDGQHYQVLSKDDFKYYSQERISWGEIKRPLDKTNYIWVSKDSLYSELELNECIHDSIDMKKVVNNRQLFNYKNFNLYLLDTFCQAKPSMGYCGSNIETIECGVETNADTPQICNLPDRYMKCLQIDFGFCDSNEKLSEDDLTYYKDYDAKLLFRYLTEPAWISSNFNEHLIFANASKEKPICVQHLVIGLFENGIDSNLDISYEVRAYNINDMYDEEFIAYTINNNPKATHYLIPPTKLEQHALFLKERDKYLHRNTKDVEDMVAIIDNGSNNASITNIGMEGFRRFNDKTDIKLSNINYFVGGNNCGKSTVVKALLLVLGNIRKKQHYESDNIFKSVVPQFRFDAEDFYDVKIKTFDRAHCRQSENKNIKFSISIGVFDIDLTVVAEDDKKSMSSADICYIKIKDNLENVYFEFDFRRNVSHLNIIGINTFEVPISRYSNNNEPEISCLIRGLASEFLSCDDGSGIEKKKWTGLIHNIADRFTHLMNKASIEYIYSHSAVQDVLFTTGNKNSYIAETVHLFYNQNFADDSDEMKFVKDWMKMFDLGSAVQILSMGGEAYVVRIVEEDGTIGDLADKGMGGIQLVAMLMRLAIIINKHKNNYCKPIVVIEEPEQNLHPAFQTRLSDLFYEISSTYGLTFIVETHSEYVVRRSQVIVSKLLCNSTEELDARNPFMVYYFPKTEHPYSMGYKLNGRFINKFKPGFFDEADKMALQLL